jgi:hypothetical protein
MVDVDVYCSHVPALADLFLKWRKRGRKKGAWTADTFGAAVQRLDMSTPKMNLPLQVGQCTIPTCANYLHGNSERVYSLTMSSQS